MSKMYIEVVTDLKHKVKIAASKRETVSMTVSKTDKENERDSQLTIEMNKKGLKRLRDSLSVVLNNFESLV